jgi:hypothetical protein
MYQLNETGIWREHRSELLSEARLRARRPTTTKDALPLSPETPEEPPGIPRGHPVEPTTSS